MNRKTICCRCPAVKENTNSAYCNACQNDRVKTNYSPAEHGGLRARDRVVCKSGKVAVLNKYNKDMDRWSACYEGESKEAGAVTLNPLHIELA